MRFIWLILLLVSASLHAQLPSYNFRHLGAAQGLLDGVVRAIGQDRYGYVWISTLSGLNRFDGYTITPFYTVAGDSTSLPPATVRAIFGDSRGRLWIGTETNLIQFDFDKQRFNTIAPLRQHGVFKIIEGSNGLLYLLTDKGVVVYNPQSNTINTLLNGEHVNDMTVYRDVVYTATDAGLKKFDAAHGATTLSLLPDSLGRGIRRLCVDSSGNIWCTPLDKQSHLVKSNNTFTSFRVYDAFQYSASGYVEGIAARMLVDKSGRFWCATNLNGLAQYDVKTDGFHFFRNDPLWPNSLSANLTTDVFQSEKGFIWVGTEGQGVDYFHPEQNLFQVLLPPLPVANELPSLWMRAFTVDKSGNYWMGISGGLVQWNGKKGTTRFFRNVKDAAPQLHSISVRALLCDTDGDIWIGTRDGVNKWNATQQKMLFLDEHDSLPRTFYWALHQDSRGVIWFGQSDNLYYRDTADKKIHSIAHHPYLARLNGRGVRVIFEDHQHRLWFGMNGSGLVLYDPLKKLVREWKRTDSGTRSLINNTVTGLAEDKSGVIWISSFTGLTAYNERKETFQWYTQKEGLPSLKTSGLLVDAQNRLWIGSTAGLIMLDRTSNSFKTFDLQDGLPTMEFSDMPATRLPDGRAVFPTVRGFVVFRPEQYKKSSSVLNAFLSSVQISGATAPLFQSAEELKRLSLKWNENFFTLQLNAFNYNNPDQTWYAYKLDGFNNDWIYTKNRFVNFTNVPGGTYTFRYKATGDPNNWRVPEKTLTIRIGTVFYKAVWFWSLVVLLLAAALYYLYQYRMRQQRRIFRLQTKAQALEKEKASVMYEGLKQQLNPHFLFNSLASLNSLIKTDQRMASAFLNGMSKIYRYILSNRDAELVPLKEEITFVANYIQLQKARFETGLEVLVDVPEDDFYKKIVPVTLQNLIENAIKHNIIDDENPLVIRIYTDTDFLVVENNLQKKKFVETSNKQGLASLKSLYRYLTNEPLQILETETCFIIKIPLL